MALSRVRYMECHVCGNYAYGRQWYNRDEGYTLCTSCGDALLTKHRHTQEDVRSLAGDRGVHWDIKGATSPTIPRVRYQL